MNQAITLKNQIKSYDLTLHHLELRRQCVIEKSIGKKIYDTNKSDEAVVIESDIYLKNADLLNLKLIKIDREHMIKIKKYELCKLTQNLSDQNLNEASL